MSKKLHYILIVLVAIVMVISQNTALANSFDISRGIMPDSIFYTLDIQLEKVQLANNQNNQDNLADLHYKFSTERLNELDYLADEDKANIEQVAVVNMNYQENIQNYSNIIKNQSQNNVEKIVPQIQELQAVQNKIVDKINEKPVEESVKVIVKSSIKESQDSLIQALATASKPIIENNSDKTKTIEVTEKIDKTISALKNYQEEVKKELSTEETNLKTKQELTSSDSEISEVKNPNPETVVENLEVNKIASTTEDNVLVSDTETIDENIAGMPESADNVIPTEWYYSSSCDYVSVSPGKDPICGGDLVAISTLPLDHIFFTKYTFKDGKYVQNINDLADKETNDITNQLTEIIAVTKQETTENTNESEPVTSDPSETTPTETEPTVTVF